MAGSILDLIGNTPMVQIKRLNSNPEVVIWAKLEGFNPGGSVKDRIGKAMIEAAEADGILTRDKTILEATSGNTGIGLALVAAVKGYRIKIVMPESMSIERRKVLAAYGADLVLTPAEEGMNGAIFKAEAMAREDDSYFMPHQFENPNNPLVHYNTTGVEILDQVGKVDVFIAGIGTSGTVTGVGKRLKEANSATKIIGVEPYLNAPIQGLKNLDEGYIPPIFNPEYVDERVYVSPDEATVVARAMASREGLFVGLSAGAAMHEALHQAQIIGRGSIVTIIPDGGDKYLSTDLFDIP